MKISRFLLEIKVLFKDKIVFEYKIRWQGQFTNRIRILNELREVNCVYFTSSVRLENLRTNMDRVLIYLSNLLFYYIRTLQSRATVSRHLD